MYPDLSNYQGSVDPGAFRKSLDQAHIPTAQPTYAPPAPVYSAPTYTPPRAPVVTSTPSPTPTPPMPNTDAIRKQMDANSATYNQTQDAGEQTRLHEANLQLGSQIGATYNPGTGEWTFPSLPFTSTPVQTVQRGIGQTGPVSQYIPGVGTVVPGMGTFQTGSSQPIQSNIPTPGMPQGVPAPLTPQQIQAEAQARIDKLLSQKNQVATQQKQSLQTEFDRQQALNKDNRVLQDAQFARQNNPFSGGTDYRRAMLDRERGITDRQAQQDLSNRFAGIDQTLADFQNQSPEQQQQIIDQLTQSQQQYGLQLAQLLQSQANADRNFGLQQGQLTGYVNGQRTLQGQQLDNEQQAALAKQQEDLRQEHIQLAQYLTQQTGKLVYPTDDPMEAFAQVADVPTLAAQKLAMDAQQVGFDQAIKKALAENTINQTQANIMLKAQEQAETAGYHQQSLSISQQNADTSAANAKTAELYKQWEATGKAPAGIPGVEPGTPLFDQVGSRQSDKPKNIDNKTSVDNAAYYKSQIQGKKGITKDQAMQYIQSNADFLNDSDYRSLLNWAQDHDF